MSNYTQKVDITKKEIESILSKKIKKSVMTGKLKNIDACNCSGLDNDFCLKMSKNPNSVCSECYHLNMLRTFRANCRPVWKNNGEILSTQDNVKLETSSIYFRWNGHGELLNMKHLENIMAITDSNPKTKFALWTKRKNLVTDYLKDNKKPDNLQLVYSNPSLKKVMKKAPEGFDKVFNVIPKEKTKNHVINCGAKSCFNCSVCYEKNDIKVINELLK